MKAVITETTVVEGKEGVWDDAYRARAKAATNQPGLIGMSLLIPFDDTSKRVVLGIWESEDDWAKWHETPDFQRTREMMNGATAQDGEPQWHQVATEHFTIGAD